MIFAPPEPTLRRCWNVRFVRAVQDSTARDRGCRCLRGRPFWGSPSGTPGLYGFDVDAEGIKDLTLLAFGAGFTLITGVVIFVLTEVVNAIKNAWRGRRDATAAIREASVAPADEALEILEKYFLVMQSTYPDAGDGYSYSFRSEWDREFLNKVLRIPIDEVREAASDAIQLLGGHNILIAFGTEKTEPYEMDQQRRALGDIRTILGAVVRKQAVPKDVVESLNTRAKHLRAARDEEFAVLNK